MPNSLSNLQPHSLTDWVVLTGQLVTIVSVTVVLGAMLVDFLDFHGRGHVKRERRSIVATWSMLSFVAIVYGLIRLRIGHVYLHSPTLIWASSFVGSAALILGAYVNVRGRIDLGKNWADQVTIYHDQTLVTGGVYGLVRHPLYASIIWMLIGASSIHSNWLAFVTTVTMFTPFMHYRARQEEEVLTKEFPAYTTYAAHVRRFLPTFHNHATL